LHRVVTDLPEEQQKLLADVRQREPALSGRKVLIVDDDVRQYFFSLASALDATSERCCTPKTAVTASPCWSARRGSIAF